MVKFSTVTVGVVLLYVLAIKYIVTSIIEYYKNRPAHMKKKTAIVLMDKIGKKCPNTCIYINNKFQA